MVEEGTNLSYS